MTEMPSGTVTFLFTDIEGSTRLCQEHPNAMQGVLARHDEILRTAIESHWGYVVKTTGDGAHAAFDAAWSRGAAMTMDELSSAAIAAIDELLAAENPTA